MAAAISTSSWSARITGARNSPPRLVDEAKRLSPGGVTLKVNKDNARAIRFYERNGFEHAGEDVNPTSGQPVLKMTWRRVTRLVEKLADVPSQRPRGWLGSLVTYAETARHDQHDIGDRQNVEDSATN